jgi:uncharacterized membrane protein YphA (DoxX/SURF4 family)
MPRIVTTDFAVPRAPTALRETTLTIALFALRAYLAFVWLRFGIMKVQGGWLTTNPLRPLLSLIAAGQLPTTVPGYSFVARALVATHTDALLSVIIPCTEIGVGLALLAGVRVRATAVIACALNVNLLLAGIASVSLDGRMIVLQVMLISLATLAPHHARRIFPAWTKRR